MSLRDRASKALKWSWVQAGFGACFQLVSTAVLARLLLPADFGLVALASVFVRFLAYFSQMGVGVSIVQREAVHPADLSALASIAVITGTGFTCIGLCLAAVVGGEVGALLRLLSISFVITGFTAVPYGLLRRTLRNREIAIIEISGQLIGYGGVTVLFAACGAGAWSIVCGVLSQQSIIAVASWVAARSTPDGANLWLSRPTRAARGYLGYGLRHSWNTFLEFAFYNIEVLLISHWYGVKNTGFYNRAYMFSHLPVEQALGSAVRVLFPVLARLRGDPDKERVTFLAAFTLSGLFASAFSAAVVAAAPELVLVMFGPDWQAMTPILRLLALAVPFRYLINLQSSWLDASGHLRPRTLTIVGCLVIKGTGLGLALHYSLELDYFLWLAILPDICWYAAYVFVLPALTSASRRSLLAANAVFLVNAVVVGGCVEIASSQLRAASANALFVVVIQVALGGALAFAAIAFTARHRLLGIRAEVVGHLPVIGRWLRGST